MKQKSGTSSEVEGDKTSQRPAARLVRWLVLLFGALFVIVSRLGPGFNEYDRLFLSLLGAWFIVPNVVFFIGSRSLEGPWVWMPGVMMALVQSWVMADFFLLPGAGSEPAVMFAPAYILVLLAVYFALLYLFRHGRGSESIPRVP